MAAVRLKGVGEQVIVITGASSGIGLVTARMAAARGARVVLVARNGAALEQAVQEIEAAGGSATHVVADVANADDMERVASEAVAAWGGIDTWINNASSSIYGRLTEVPLADKKRLMDVTFWGVVHGCRAALPHLRERGGALINVGSVASDQSLPLLGMYAAAKHAVKGYTDALRIELEAEGVPVQVTLVKPTSIDTMFFAHARNYMDVEPKPVPPVYAPEVVAGTLLHCAEHPTRDIFVGGAARVMTAMGNVSGTLADRYLEATGFASQRSDRPARDGDNLYDFAEDGRERGGYQGMVRETSLYTATQKRPWAVLLGAAAVGLAFAALGSRTPAPRARAAREDEATVHGDTSLTDALMRGEVEAAAPPRGTDQAVARPVVAPLADVGGTSTEDSASASLLDPSFYDETPAGLARRGSTGGTIRQGSPGYDRTDEDWQLLG